MPYQLVPVLDQADEILQPGWTILQKVSLEFRETDGELALQPQGGAHPDEPSIDFWVRPVVDFDITCEGGFTQLTPQPFPEVLGSIWGD